LLSAPSPCRQDSQQDGRRWVGSSQGPGIGAFCLCRCHAASVSPLLLHVPPGTFGRVLECWDRKHKDYVAIKIVRNIDKYRHAAMIEVTSPSPYAARTSCCLKTLGIILSYGCVAMLPIDLACCWLLVCTAAGSAQYIGTQRPNWQQVGAYYQKLLSRWQAAQFLPVVFPSVACN
jgi:hypothetical protein